MYNVVEAYAGAVYSAIYNDLGLDEKGKRYAPNEIDVYAFPQTWGSTTLGFGGIGGSAMTTALTVVVIHFSKACVYFAGMLAYKVEGINQTFYDDLRSFDMKEVSRAGVYRRGN